MGFPVGYTELFLPKIFLHTLSLLSLVRICIFALLRLVGLADFLESDAFRPEAGPAPESPAIPVAAVLLRELLPVVKFGGGGAAESCTVCLYEFAGGEEIRRLANCRHIFHRSCVDRWMDHDQKTCPLCRTPFVPEDMWDEFNQRLWAASGGFDPFTEYGPVSGP